MENIRLLEIMKLFKQQIETPKKNKDLRLIGENVFNQIKHNEPIMKFVTKGQNINMVYDDYFGSSEIKLTVREIIDYLTQEIESGKRNKKD